MPVKVSIGMKSSLRLTREERTLAACRVWVALSLAGFLRRYATHVSEMWGSLCCCAASSAIRPFQETSSILEPVLHSAWECMSLSLEFIYSSSQKLWEINIGVLLRKCSMSLPMQSVLLSGMQVWTSSSQSAENINNYFLYKIATYLFVFWKCCYRSTICKRFFSVANLCDFKISHG